MAELGPHFTHRKSGRGNSRPKAARACALLDPWLRSAGGSQQYAKARQAYVNSSQCIMFTKISVCRMPAYACPYRSPKRRKGRARRNAAPVYAGDGREADRPRLDTTRGGVVSRTAVAP